MFNQHNFILVMSNDIPFNQYNLNVFAMCFTFLVHTLGHMLSRLHSELILD